MNDFKIDKFCPSCGSDALETHSYYKVKGGDRRKMCSCMVCNHSFSETYGSVIYGLKTPLSRIEQVLKAFTEGMGVNALCRTFHVAKSTLKNWLDRFSSLQEVLMLYSLCHEYLELVIEGDELYTRIKKTLLPMKVRVGQLS